MPFPILFFITLCSLICTVRAIYRCYHQPVDSTNRVFRGQSEAKHTIFLSIVWLCMTLFIWSDTVAFSVLWAVFVVAVLIRLHLSLQPFVQIKNGKYHISGNFWYFGTTIDGNQPVSIRIQDLESGENIIYFEMKDGSTLSYKLGSIDTKFIDGIQFFAEANSLSFHNKTSKFSA